MKFTNKCVIYKANILKNSIQYFLIWYQVLYVQEVLAILYSKLLYKIGQDFWLPTIINDSRYFWHTEDWELMEQVLMSNNADDTTDPVRQGGLRGIAGW